MATTVTISIPSPADAHLRQRAADSGKPLDVYVTELVERAAAQRALLEILGPLHDEVRESGATEAEVNAVLEGALTASRVARRPQ